MRSAVIIPARWASTRFPGKPLAPIQGRPMLWHVWSRARQSRADAVIIATDDERIESAAREFGARVRRTQGQHRTGSERVAEVLRASEHQVVVNLQGDEPLVDPAAINALLQLLQEEPEVQIGTLVHRGKLADQENPDRVKVALDAQGMARWFTRSPLPHPRAEQARPWLHIGLYAYRRQALLELVATRPTPCERAESLEQLRALETGGRIRALVWRGWRGTGVDRPEDIPLVEALLREEAAEPPVGC